MIFRGTLHGFGVAVSGTKTRLTFHNTLKVKQTTSLVYGDTIMEKGVYIWRWKFYQG